MSPNDDRLEELGRKIGSNLGPGPDAERLFFQQSAILAAAGRRRRNAARFTLAVLATAGAVFGLLMLLTPPEERFGFRVKGEQPYGSRVLLQAAAENLPVDFEDGSRVEILAGSAAQILESSPRRVELRLASGAIAANIHRAEERSWSIRAGPYSVFVVGTEFSVSWRPERAEIEISVARGAVRVAGPGVAEETTVATGERWVRADKDRTPVAEVTPDPAKDTASRMAVTRPAPASLPPETGESSPNDAAAAKLADAPAGRDAILHEESPLTAWRLLHHVGEYRSALAAVGDSFEDLLVSLGADDLWRLAETCRLARDSSRAVRALEAFRGRFPQSPRSRLAAFLLATVALELAQEPAAALTWFERYLEEAPRGPLVEEALGRSIQAALDAGQPDKARDAARRYLDEFTNGPYADDARALLSR